MNFLIVEDDNTVIMLLKMLLSRRGYRFYICVGIEEGPIDPHHFAVINEERETEYIDVEDFDVAILDGNLVGDVLGTKAVEPAKQFGLVTVCTSANLELVKEFKALGVDYVREKGQLLSFFKDDLGEAIALRQSRLANR